MSEKQRVESLGMVMVLILGLVLVSFMVLVMVMIVVMVLIIEEGTFDWRKKRIRGVRWRGRLARGEGGPLHSDKTTLCNRPLRPVYIGYTLYVSYYTFYIIH